MSIYDDYAAAQGIQAPAPLPSRGMVAPQPSGQNGLMGYVEAPVAGAYEAASQLGSAAQAGAKLFGATDAANAAAAWAQRQRETAATYQSPDLEKLPWYDPRGLAYNVLKGAPVAAGMLAAGAATGGAADAGVLGATAARLGGGMVGGLTAGVAGYPLAVGGNVQTSEASHPDLTSGQALKSAVLGVPEAVVGALPYGRLLGREAAGSVVGAATRQAAEQALAGAAQNTIAQQMNDRSIPFRMSEMLQSALTGGVTGAIMGGGVHAGLHAFAKADPNQVSTEAIDNATKAVDPAAAPPQRMLPAPTPTPPPDVVQAGPPADIQSRQFAHLSDQDLLARGTSLSQNGQDPAALAGIVQEMQLRVAAAPEPAAEPIPAAPEPAAEPTERTAATPTETPTPAAEPALREQLKRAQAAEAEPAPGAAPEPTTPEPNRPDISIIKQSMQPRWQDAEALREQTQDPAIHKEIDDVQTRLQSPKSGGEVKSIDKAIGSIRTAIDGEKAKGDLAAARGELPPAPQPTPAEAPKVAPQPADQPKAVTDLQDAVKAAKQSAVQMSKITAPDTGSAVHDQHVNQEWKAGVAQQAAKLKAVDDALKSGDAATLSSLPDEHFVNDALWNNEKLGDQQIAALDAHSNLEQDVLDAARRAFPRAASATAEPAPPVSPHDQDTAQIVQNGGTLKDVLQHYASNGSTGLVKTMANILAKKGVDAPIQFAPPSGSPLNLREGQRQEASYTPATNTIRLHQNSDLERLVLHEGAHAATFNAIEKGGAVAKELSGLLDQAKQQSPGGDINGLSNVHEFVAEAYSNEQFRQYLDSLPADDGKVTIWRAFKNAVGKIFGIDGGAKQTVLDRVMDAGGRAMDQNAAAPASDGRVYSLHTPEEADARVSGYIHKAMEIMPRVDQELLNEARGGATNIAAVGRKLAIGWKGARDLANLYGKDSPGMVNHVDATERKSLLGETNSKVGAVASNKERALSDADRKAVGAVIDTTHAGFNPEKSVAEWVADNPDKNTPEMIKEQRRSQTLFHNLSPAGGDNYSTTKATNEARLHQTYATFLYDTIRSAYGDKIALPEDHTELHRTAFDVHDDPIKDRDFWAAAVKKLQDAAQPHINDQVSKAVELEAKVAADKAAKQVTPATQKAEAQADALREGVEPLAGLLGEYYNRVDAMNKVPNFHMGRGGDYYAAGHLPMTADGKPDPAAIEALQNKLNAAGMGDISLNRYLDSPTFYARVQNRGDSDKLASILRDQGIERISNGPAADLSTTAGAMPKWRDKMLTMAAQRMRSLGEGADDATKAAIEAQIGDMKREALNALPDSAVNKINARRAGVQGYSADWGANFRQRDANTSRMLANVASAPYIAEAALQMRKDVQAMNARPSNEVSIGQKEALQQAVQELLNKDATSPITKPNSFISTVNSLSHTFELGFSVPYGLMLMSQNLTLGLPRLGAAVGYVKGAQLMAKNSVKSLDTLRIALKGQDAKTFGLRQSELEKAGVSKADIDLLMAQQAMGSLNHSGYTTAMTGAHADAEGTLNNIRHMANMTTLYSEMQPRVLMAYAARDAWKADPKLQAREGMNDFVYRMIQRSQFPWDSLSTPRELTTRGTFGQMSPLINKFMGYQVRLTNELTHSLHEAFGTDPQMKAEATKFLAGHVAAISVLAGTMGLPMVGVAASVFDKMADLATNKDDWDVTAAYRNFLAQTFGKQAGEAIARGAPRLFGLDFSHMGDEKLLPGSTAALMLTEKRKLEDAEKDWLKSEAGAPMGTLANMIFAGRDLANGDYLRGAQKMVPEALRGPTEAAQLALHGYRDKGGTKLPITPGARDIALTAMGLDPEKEAEYSEAQKTATGAVTLAQLRSQNITQHLAQAQQRGDQENFRYWQDQSQDYQQDHPGMRPPIMDLQRYLQQHLRQAAFAQSMGLPMGVKPQNLVGRGMVGFANLQH